ncbi:MAG: UDP-3-O-(3-hydroxymyristoyl)glucosamine N-acyltransferase [Firmicutes bacterium]|nr:UDP-3-O-(3-hydroxymyristoyl)glucosamine N-acyltransferase [Bacillota bacterium]
MQQKEPVTLSELATLVNGEVIGDPHILISGIGTIYEARPGQLVMAEDERKLKQALELKPTALLLPFELADKGAEVKGVIKVQNPRLAFARLLAYFAPQYSLPQGIHPEATVSPKAKLGKNVRVHARAVIEEGAQIGDGTWIWPGVYIGPDAVIGSDCLIYPNVVIRERVTIGDRVIIQPGAVIGSDGFGFVTVDGVHHKVPQIGTVEIGNDVEIGANTCIDRATVGKTVIGTGTKLDNLVQIGHNAEIGPYNLMAGMAGVAGSSRTGEYVTLAGKAGLAGHLTVAPKTVVAGGAIVASDVTEPGFLSGIPARPHREEMRAKATMRRVPELIKKQKELERKVAELTELLERLSAEAR